MVVTIIKPRMRVLSGRSVPLTPKVADAYLLTPEHKEWRRQVLRRAGYQCEKCGRTNVRLFADHIKERRDGGVLLDVSNGQALCGACHTKKTNVVRKNRIGI